MSEKLWVEDFVQVDALSHGEKHHMDDILAILIRMKEHLQGMRNIAVQMRVAEVPVIGKIIETGIPGQPTDVEHKVKCLITFERPETDMEYVIRNEEVRRLEIRRARIKQLAEKKMAEKKATQEAGDA